MSITMKKVGSAPHHELMIADAEDILIVVPEQGFKDTAEASRITVAALQELAADQLIEKARKDKSVNWRIAAKGREVLQKLGKLIKTRMETPAR